MKSTFTLLLFVTLLFVTLSLCAHAQDAEINREMMKKVDWGLGRWEGKGWIESSMGGRLIYTSTETVESKLGGLVFLFEGKSQFKREGGGTEIVNAAQLSVLNYDPKKECYLLRSYTDDGKVSENEMKYEDRTFRWEKRDEARGVNQRFTTRLDDDGRLIYTGESSNDQKKWREFFHAEYRLVDKAAK